MTLDSEKDLEAIKEWIAKENYLPKDLDTVLLKKFLHSCYGSLEKTKKCIEKFTCGRHNMPELYTSRDPTSKRLQNAFSITNISTYKAGKDELLIHLLDVPNSLDKFDYYDVLKTFLMQADFWLKVHDFLPEGHIVVLDIKYYSLRLVAKSNVFFFQKFLLFLLEAMPVRLKEVHVVNCPSFYEKLYALVKGILPAEVNELIRFHNTYEGLHSHIDKKYLPIEYGGDAPSMAQQHNDWVKAIEEDRKNFLRDDLWKADLSKKPKKNGDDVLNGSFRTLSID